MREQWFPAPSYSPSLFSPDNFLLLHTAWQAILYSILWFRIATIANNPVSTEKRSTLQKFWQVSFCMPIPVKI